MPTPRRKNIRLPGYDYSAEGTYFVTIVTKDREVLFGDVVNGEMVLNEYGRIVAEEWTRSASIRKEIEMDEYVVMPNHFHAIVHIIPDNKFHRTGDPAPTIDLHCTGDRPNNDIVGAYGHTPLRKPFKSPSRSLGALARGFKSAVTTRINSIRHTPGLPVWQRNYYDHIISTDREYEQVAEYIANNPLYWLKDEENK